jgi:GrpB-like predicted nucleotidyltransferase (UPF0157 family)
VSRDPIDSTATDGVAADSDDARGGAPADGASRPSRGEYVELVEPRPDEWAQRCAMVSGRIARIVPDAVLEHIGSTAVPGFPAKDVVDVLVGVEAELVAEAAERLADDGFDLEGARPTHCWLSLPDRTSRTVVVHVMEADGTQWRGRVAFRDILIQDPAARAEYLAVKKAAARATDDWGEYTMSKAETVRKLLDADAYL